MKISETEKLSPADLKPIEREWIYNGLDACVTHEVLGVLLPQLDETTSATYDFSRALQGPALDMRLRGVLVDQQKKEEVIEISFQRLDLLERGLERITGEGLGFWDFNWRSPQQLRELFYETLLIPEIRKRSTGKPTVDRSALEKMESYNIARPIIMHMKAMRDLGKKISVLRTEMDPDGRMRTSYNIAGTHTGRWSSSFSEFGTGGNLQNVEDILRPIFISDPGMKMGYFDAEQGESYVVGAIEWNLLGDGRYLDACESGDLHTAVAKVCWPDLPWTGDAVRDRAIAEQPFYRHNTYRFTCKKLGHGSNYLGGPGTLSHQSKVEQDVIEEFQEGYFQAFPHKLWHEAVESQ